MSDIELVIKIDEDAYKEIKKIVADENEMCFMQKLIANGTPLPKCKHCKHFEYDTVAMVDGIPLIVCHEMCKKWGDGCKTQEDGYCFLFEPIEN